MRKSNHHARLDLLDVPHQAVALGRLELEPEGYTRVTIDRKPPFTFDLVYQKGPDDVVLVDTLAADETAEGFHAAGGPIVHPGTRTYVVAAADRFKATLPDLAASIQRALLAGKLRYYEVRQPIDASGKLGPSRSGSSSCEPRVGDGLWTRPVAVLSVLLAGT